MNAEICVREARAEDWDGIWRVLEPAFRAGETYTYPQDISSGDARAAWMSTAAARVLVAVNAEPGDDTILGTAKYLPNHPGAGSHVANASFVVGPDGSGRGIGRRLARAVLEGARADGYLAMQFNAVVETNTRAVRLWQDFGFEILATVPQAFAHPTRGLVGLHIMYRAL